MSTPLATLSGMLFGAFQHRGVLRGALAVAFLSLTSHAELVETTGSAPAEVSSQGEPPAASQATQGGRVELLRRLFARYLVNVKGAADARIWTREDFEKYGTPEQWDEALEQWRSSSRVLVQLARGQKNREEYQRLLRDGVLEELSEVHPDTEAANRVLLSYLVFLRTQRDHTQHTRRPLEAEVLAREEILRRMSGLPPDQRLSPNQWANDPDILRQYNKLRTRYELEEVDTVHFKIPRLAFERWKRSELQELDRAMAANLLAAAEVAPPRDIFDRIARAWRNFRGKGRFTVEGLEGRGGSEPVDLSELRVQLDPKGYVQTDEVKPRRVKVDGRSIFANGLGNHFPTFRPGRSARGQAVEALKRLNQIYQDIRSALIEARHTNPPTRLMGQLQEQREKSETWTGDPSKGRLPVVASAPGNLEEALNAGYWVGKDPHAWWHRPWIRVNVPLSPTVQEVVTENESMALRRGLAKWARRAILGAGILAAGTGLSYGAFKTLQAIGEGLGYRTYFNSNPNAGADSFQESFGAVYTGGNHLVDESASFGLQGKPAPPDNGASRYTIEYEDESKNADADRKKGKVIWDYRWKEFPSWPDPKPLRYELSYVDHPSFGGRRKVVLPRDQAGSVHLDSAVPQQVRQDGQVVLPIPEKMGLSAVRVFRKDGQELTGEKDFQVYLSDRNHAALLILNADVKKQGTVHVQLGFSAGSGSRYFLQEKGEFYQTHFAKLDKTRVAELLEQMKQAGMTNIAESAESDLKWIDVSVEDVARWIRAGSLYSERPETESRVSRDNPFWFVSRAVNEEGVLCGDCDVVNEAAAVFFEQYFKNTPEVFVERGVLFHSYSPQREIPLHANVYLGSVKSGAKVALDATPYQKDERDYTQHKKVKSSESMARASAPAGGPGAKETRRQGLPGAASAGVLASSFTRSPKPEELTQEPAMVYDHRFRFRGDVPGWETETQEPAHGPKEPEEQVLVRRKVLDPESQVALQRMERARTVLMGAMQALTRRGSSERLPQHASFDISKAVQAYVNGDIDDAEFQKRGHDLLLRKDAVAPQSGFHQLAATLVAQQKALMAQGAQRDKEGALSKRYDYLADPVVQKIVQEPVQIAAATEWKPPTYDHHVLPRRDYERRLECGQALERLLVPMADR